MCRKSGRCSKMRMGMQSPPTMTGESRKSTTSFHPQHRRHHRQGRKFNFFCTRIPAVFQLSMSIPTRAELSSLNTPPTNKFKTSWSTITHQNSSAMNPPALDIHAIGRWLGYVIFTHVLIENLGELSGFPKIDRF